MRFRYLEYLGWPSDIAWHGFRKGISDCATQSLSDMPFRLIWEIIQNPFCLRSVMQWPQHQSFGTLSTFLQVLDSSGFCCHCVLNRTSFRILKNWKLSGSRARRGPMSGELSAAMSRGAQRKLDKGLIFHPTAGEHVQNNNMSIVVIVIGEHAKKNTEHDSTYTTCHVKQRTESPDPDLVPNQIQKHRVTRP